MANQKLVIFDCDGVLVDSEQILHRVFAEMLTEVGLPITYEETTRQLMGQSLATCIAMIEQSYQKTLPKDFIERCKAREFAVLRQEVQPVFGISEALEKITLPKCVASNNSHRHIQLVLTLTQLLAHFDGKIYSSHDVDRPQPFPDVYLHAAQQMGFQPEECVVIEDSIPGVQAAYAAGMTVFGYTSHQLIETHRDALVAAGAKAVFAQMQQLPNLIDAIKSPQ
ncbi:MULTISPECIES: HAD family hydrolase [Leptolyngbya]|uniref:HAD family hydrolase n=1 Tax=Leptolyngbya TaxID=47251 RepID=UPI001683EBDD|nr:HAD family hydrolase [Leptolyngbya sp. FACHB-1624]MBD1855063.1 HAD family hydrolase [Leptolyngbya sp. FACHB-1624]